MSWNSTGSSDYNSLLKQYEALLTGRWLTDLANTSAFIFSEVKDLNWVGFYLYDQVLPAEANLKSTLYLGPFQGKPACTEIPFGKGVCGTAAAQLKTILVEDVDQFPGHIVCDASSKSEIVVPLLKKGQIYGVLDVDSPTKARFAQKEQQFFESLVKILMKE